ncbi:MAG: hypothetical protein M3Q08_06915 [Pseudomonadota bacterium]|nr:hypothetical protein [Pseudomonadota bacterium]
MEVPANSHALHLDLAECGDDTGRGRLDAREGLQVGRHLEFRQAALPPYMLLPPVHSLADLQQYRKLARSYPLSGTEGALSWLMCY